MPAKSKRLSKAISNAIAAIDAASLLTQPTRPIRFEAPRCRPAMIWPCRRSKDLGLSQHTVEFLRDMAKLDTKHAPVAVAELNRRGLTLSVAGEVVKLEADQ